MTSFTLTNIGWVDLGPGPMVVRLNSGGGAYLSVGASAPSWGASGSPLGVSSGDPTSASLSGTSHVWARAATISGAQVSLTTFVAGQGGGSPPPVILPIPPLEVATPTPAAIYSGQIKIATTNTAVALPSQAFSNGLVVKAKNTNVGNGFVGPSGVTATDDGTGNGYRLLPGEAWSGAPANASAVYVNGTIGDIYYWTGN